MGEVTNLSLRGDISKTAKSRVRPVTPGPVELLTRTLEGVDTAKPSTCDIRLLRAVLIGESETPIIIQASTAALQLGSNMSHFSILHLATAAIYNLSKDKANDKCFMNSDFTASALKALGMASLSPQARAHLAGTFKNISTNPANRRMLVKKGALDTCCGLLRSEFASDVEHFDEKKWTMVLLVTSTLRNLAADREHACTFRKAGAIRALTDALKYGINNEDLVYNVSRVLSKLSLDEGCKACMENEAGLAELLVCVLRTHKSSHKTIVRVAFVIGNLAMDSEPFRSSVARCDDAVPILVELCAHANRECLAKLVRAVANLSLLDSIGRRVAATPAAIDVTTSILNDSSADPQGEIVLVATAALANLTFYREDLNPQIVAEDLCWSTIIAMLAGRNEECILESSRLCANLSQDCNSRRVMLATPVVQTLVMLLDHSVTAIVTGVCGALINFAADEHITMDLLEMELPDKLQGALELAGSPQIDHMEALDLAQVCSKALLNLVSCLSNIQDPKKFQLLEQPMLDCLGGQVKDILARFDGWEAQVVAPILALRQALHV